MPEGEEWLFWRIVTSPRTKDSQFTIAEEWSFEDLLVTNEVYDALDAAEAIANMQSQAKGR